jgi:LuxR family transcriptional regulator, maltose regulon positive regulatory protein
MLPLLLSTKLYFPPLRGGLVSRPRLIERLMQGLQLSLTLISAPAGSGKSTLLSAWHVGDGNSFPTAWLSLDTGDNDPRRFLTYLARALETLQEGLITDTLLLLHSPQQESIETILTSLINDLAGFPSDFALVLDDFHLITSPALQAGMTYLLEHQPSQMHLVILTRLDPPLPLSRLRGRAQLLEIRAADLRFTSQEATAFFNDVIGLGLAREDIDALERRVEGWAAGLQLTATALQARLAEQGKEDVHHFVSAFTGSHHYIVEYLVEEVLNQQPEHVRNFLLRTSIMDRFNAELCEFILRDKGQEIRDKEEGPPDALPPIQSSPVQILDYLDKANLFLQPLDDHHEWFRYHTLFADMLRRRLQQSEPAFFPKLHRYAAEWLGQHDLPVEALKHTLAAGDLAMAARLLEVHGKPMLTRGEWVTLADNLRILGDMVHQRPILGMLQAWVFSLTGHWEPVKGLLVEVERLAAEDNEMDAKAKTDLTGEISTLHGLMAYFNGDARTAIEACRQALERLAPENLAERSIAAHILGEACNRCGDLPGAVQANTQAAEWARATGSLSMSVSALTALGDLQMGQGQLHAAMQKYEEALRRVTRPDGKRWLPAGRALICMSKVPYEWNDLEFTGQIIREGLNLCRQSGDLEYRIIGKVMESRLKEAEGDLEGANQAMQEAEGFVKAYTVPATTISLVEAFRARLLLSQAPAAAFHWADLSGLRTTDEISFIREQEYRSLARIAAQRGEIIEALSLVNRLYTSAESAGRLGLMIYLLVLQAGIYHLSGYDEKAEKVLVRGLGLAQPEGFQRVFLDEGESMRKLLVRIKKGGKAHGMDSRLRAYLDNLISNFGVSEEINLLEEKEVRLAKEGLLETLTEREVEVLHLVANGKTNQEIASELFLAVGTVKRHLNNIFGKLGVQNRTACVAKAREMRLI